MKRGCNVMKYYLSINTVDGRGAVEMKYMKYYVITACNSTGFPFMAIIKSFIKINKQRLCDYLTK